MPTTTRNRPAEAAMKPTALYGSQSGMSGPESGTTVAEAPRPLSEHELALAATGTQAMVSTQGAIPTMAPPGTPGATVAMENASAWLTSKKVVALWSNRTPRNAYAYIDGAGWRRLADTNDSAHTCLTALASAARQTGSTVNLRDEGDGRIRELYVW